MGLDEPPKESVHIRVDKNLFISLEKLRTSPLSNYQLNRSDIYGEALFYGEKLLQLKRDLGDKEFERVWRWFNKLNLEKADIEKIL
jgi:hypothetical protein